MGEHIAVLANPRAGKGRARPVADEVIRHLEDSGAVVRTYVGDSPDATRILAQEALSGSPAVLVVVGGDGTVSDVLDLLCAARVPMALVPAGTGNDLARALGLPRGDPAAAAALARRGVPHAIDVGEVRSAEGTALFLTVAALGFDARVSERTNRLRWPRGVIRYYLALVVELARLRPLSFRIAVDDEAPATTPGTLIAVGNTASYGGGMPVCIGARPDDGLLDVVHVAPLGRWRLVRLFPLLLRGRHLRRPEVTHRRVRAVTISAPDLVAYADGERVGSGSCRIAVRQGALTVMLPQGSGDDD